MNKISIIENPLSIKKVIKVIEAQNNNCRKRLYSNGKRGCDVFVYVISGSCDYTCEDGTSFTVSAGDIFYLAKDEIYSLYIREENYRFIFCDFEFFDSLPRQSGVFTPKHDYSSEKLFIKLLNLYNSQPITYFADSLSVLYSIYSSMIASKSDNYMTSTTKNKIGYARQYIDTHYNYEGLSVFSLAEMLKMSDVYFRKLFKAEIGISPSKYIISVRLKKAKQLIEDYPFLNLEECAKQSGFSSLHYFSRVFTAEFGINPSKYKKNG